MAVIVDFSALGQLREGMDLTENRDCGQDNHYDNHQDDQEDA